MLIDVTQEEFFAALKADPRDIMPRIVSDWSQNDGYVKEWETNDNRREPFGRSTMTKWQLHKPTKGVTA